MPTAPRETPPSPSIASAVRRHITQVDDGEQLITVRHQPQGPVAYLLEPDDELVVQGIDIVGGNVITQAVHERWGKVYVLTNGPSVTEVCLHDDEDQRQVYRDRCRELEAQYIQVLTSLDDDSDLEP